MSQQNQTNQIELAGIVVCTISGVVVLWLTSLPAGIPEQWVWQKHAIPTSFIEWFDRFISGIFAGAAICWLSVFGVRKLASGQAIVERSSDQRSGGNGMLPEKISVSGSIRSAAIRTTILLTMLTVATFLWHSALQKSAPSPHRDVKGWWVLYDKYASGYFFEAAFEIESADSLLQGYEARMQEGDVLHVGTHPPGLFLMNLGALWLTDKVPAAVSVLESIRSEETVRIFRELEAHANVSAPLTSKQLAALQLVSLMTSMLAAATVIPVFLFTRRLACPEAAWMAACCYATMPAIAIFSPKSDVLFAATGMTFLWLTSATLLTRKACVRWACGVAAGASLFVGMMLSLAHIPIVVLVICWGSILIWKQDRVCCIERLTGLVAIGVTLIVCALLFSVLTGCDLIAVWRLNLKNHEGFYGTSPRTWWKWTLYNPIELAFAGGVPVVLLGLSLFVRRTASVMQSLFMSPMNAQRRPFDTFAVASVLTWCALWLSGKNMGEAARLWCFLLPWFAVAAGVRLLDGSHSGLGVGCTVSDSAESRTMKLTQAQGAFGILDSPCQLWIAMTIQTFFSLATASRINGFSI